MLFTITADRQGERSWGRFYVYCKFMKDLGRLNLGQELLKADLMTLRSVAWLNNEIISPCFLEVRSTLSIFVHFYG